MSDKNASWFCIIYNSLDKQGAKSLVLQLEDGLLCEYNTVLNMLENKIGIAPNEDSKSASLQNMWPSKARYFSKTPTREEEVFINKHVVYFKDFIEEINSSNATA